MKQVYSKLFSPYGELAQKLANLLPDCRDGSHDSGHLSRVWRFACQIRSEVGGDPLVLFAAAFLHDCVQVEKSDPLRQYASRWSARRAGEALRDLNWPAERIDQVCHAISAHSRSARIPPTTLEARIIHDADRLDSTGAIGIARCFYVAGRIGSVLYNQTDPTAQDRTLDDMSNALDHFKLRLICDCNSFHTKKARDIAHDRIAFIEHFQKQFLGEIGDLNLLDQYHANPWGLAQDFIQKNDANHHI